MKMTLVTASVLLITELRLTAKSCHASQKPQRWLLTGWLAAARSGLVRPQGAPALNHKKVLGRGRGLGCSQVGDHLLSRFAPQQYKQTNKHKEETLERKGMGAVTPSTRHPQGSSALHLASQDLTSQMGR